MIAEILIKFQESKLWRCFFPFICGGVNKIEIIQCRLGIILKHANVCYCWPVCCVKYLSRVWWLLNPATYPRCSLQLIPCFHIQIGFWITKLLLSLVQRNFLLGVNICLNSSKLNLCLSQWTVGKLPRWLYIISCSSSKK